MDTQNGNETLDKYGHKVGQDWTVKELATAVNVSPGRIRQLIVDDVIKSYLRTNRLRMIKYFDGLEFISTKNES